MIRRVGDWCQRSFTAARRRLVDQPLWGITSSEHAESLWRRRRSRPIAGSEAKIALQLDFYVWPSCLLKQIRWARFLLTDSFNYWFIFIHSLIYMLSLNLDSVFIHISEFMYRFTHNLFPSAFSGYFSNVGLSDIHSYHTRSSKNLRCSTARTNTRMFSIKSVGPCIWNRPNLPTGIRNISSLALYNNKSP